MKLPLTWLTSLVDVDLPLDELVDVMSLHGLEVEEVARPGAGTAGVRAARVLHHRPHPEADSLRLVVVTGDDGEGEVEVVCGATNFDVGDMVLHAPPGATIPGMTLEARTIRGATSAGMLCSARELELGDDHSGLLVLPPGTPPGTAVGDLVPIGEPVIEIAVQADRGDHLGIVGVARDLAAILDTDWRLPACPAPVDGPTLPVEIATDGCARFETWSLEGAAIGPSPLWMRHRLAQCGVRSIDAVVDVTNFVMLEFGQPLHAFDLDRIAGPRLRVREAATGEWLTTLDDVERELVVGDLVIEDVERVVSLAGVMGGRDTEVGPTTTRVLLEAAVWRPTSIRATSRRLGLVSEASSRFERRVDPEAAALAAARAAGLVCELTGARATGTAGAQSSDATFTAVHAVDVDPDRVRGLLGMDDLDDTAQRRILQRAGCAVDDAGATWRVTPPSWRGDLRRPADVAEEVARLAGYDRIPAELPHVRVRGGLTVAQRLVREARTAALARGFDEAVTRPFVGDEALVGTVPTDGRVRLANPLAKDAAAMRPSLVEGLLGALRHNVGQGRPGTGLVEIGRVFRPDDDAAATTLATFGDAWRWTGPAGESLPVQPLTLGLAAQGLLVGDHWLGTDHQWSVYDVLAVLDDVAACFGDDRGAVRLTRRAATRAGFHPSRSAQLLLDGVEVGFVGQLHPDEAERRDLPEPVVVGELLLEALLAHIADAPRKPVTARVLPRHPAMTVDVALVAHDDVPFGEIAGAITRGAGELLDDWWWFDEYRGAPVPDGHRSLAVRLRLHDVARQLTDDDAERVIEGVAAAAAGIGATLRR